MSEFCTCTLCGPCVARTEAAANRAARISPKSQDPRKQPQQAQRPLGIASAVVVYVLGDIAQGDGTTKRQLDLYSSMNGYHIRTIPATRWTNPVLIGAGEGFLAVVDRFGDHDIIRVTDPYAGAGAGSYDDNGFPVKGVNFGSFQDIKQILTPKGTHCTGVKILPRGELVAGIDDGKGNCRYVKSDIHSSGFYAYEGELDTEDAFKTLGTPVGSPSVYDASPSLRMHDFVHVAKTSDGTGVVHITNHFTGKVGNLIGLPAGTPLGVAHSSEWITVLHLLASGDSQLIRLPIRSNSYMLAGVEGNTMVPTPQEYQTTHTFSPRDVPFPATPTDDAVRVYLRQAGYINTANSADIPPEVIARLAQLHAKGQPWLRMIDSASSTALNDGRTQVGGQIAITRGVGKTSIPASIISVPASSGLIGLESSHGTISELYNKVKNDGTMDPNKPIFRSVHASHYDWLSEGGWTYGCALPGKTTQDNAVTSGLKGISIATDISAEPGMLKDLPDLKVAIIDADTGLILYHDPKPRGYTMFGGSYAEVALADASEVTQSLCGQETEKIATQLDGIQRPSKEAVVVTPETQYTDPVYAPEYSNQLDCDFPWALDTRRVLSQKPAKVKLTENSWTFRDDDGAIKKQWRDNLLPPVVTTQTSVFYYPGPKDDAKFQPSAYSGFFNITLPKEQTTRCEEQAADLGDAQSSLQDAQSQLAAIEGQPEQYSTQIATLKAQITSLNAQIASLTILVNECDPTDPDNVQFLVPRPIRNMILGPLDTSDGQVIDPKFGIEPTIIATPIEGAAWTTTPVPEINGYGTDIQRGVVIKPNIRSWIATEIKLARFSAFNDGAAGWATPEARKGLFGARIGTPADSDLLHFLDGDAQDVCGGVHAGGIYDSGDTAGSGAVGSWEIEVFANGVKIDSIATLCSFDQQITDQAPGDMADQLVQTFYVGKLDDGSGDDTGYHKGFVYWSDQVITSIMIKVKLVNYAFDVYRFGWRTVERGTPPGPLEVDPDGYCRIGRDPGFYVDNNCEAFCVGNVFCGDYVFQGRQLCNQDPPSPVVRNVLWQGTATYTIPVNPYEKAGIGVGNYINAYFDFDLVDEMAQYDINIRSGEGRAALSGTCVNGGAA